MAKTYQELLDEGVIKPESKTGSSPSVPPVSNVSKPESAIRGFANAATFGLAPKISAGANALLGKVAPDVFGDQSYDERLKDYLAADKDAAAANPVTSTVAAAGPMLIQALATGGGSLGRQAAVNAAEGAANVYGNSADPTLGGIASGAALQTGLATLPAAGLKVADNFSNSMAKKAIVENLHNRLKMPLKDTRAGFEEIIGDTAPNLAKEGTNLRAEIRHLADAVAEKGARVKDFDTLTGAVADQLRTPLRQQAGDIGKSVRDAVVGGVGGAVAGMTLGENIDPLSTGIASAIGAGVGGLNRAGLNTAKNVAIKAATRTGVPGKVLDAAERTIESGAYGPAAQIAARAATSDILESTNLTGTSPFAQLSDFIKTAGSVLPSTMTPEEKRKEAMKLQSSAGGRAALNGESPLRKDSNTD